MSGHLHCQRPAASPNPEKNQDSNALRCLKARGIAELTERVLIRMGLGEESACTSTTRPGLGWGGISEDDKYSLSFWLCTQASLWFWGVRGPGR